MISKANLYASEEEVHSAWIEWSKYRVCVRCGVTYNLLGSFGSWQCRQHLCKPVPKQEGNKRVVRYWECCKQRPYPITYNRNERVWSGFRNTKHVPTIVEVEGCLRCDHTENVRIVDDGVRMGQKKSMLAPLGGYTIGDIVIHKNKQYEIEEVYYDDSVYLTGVGKTAGELLIWPEEVSIGDRCNWNSGGGSFPVKILNIRGSTVDLAIQNHGVAVHDVAAMIPYMDGDPTTRPGWQFEKVDGKTLFPYIKQAESSFRTKSKLLT